MKNKRNILLSHTLSFEKKFYKDSKGNFLKKEKYSDGFFNRETEICINSHMGTHIDFPAHFIENGNFGECYDLDFLCSKNICLINFDLTKEKKPKLTLDIFNQALIPKDAEFLFINTNFHAIRDKKKYIWESPIIDSKIPLFLKRDFPNIKLVGLDVISLTSQLDRKEGKECHFNFLSQKEGREILVVEDMCFKNLKEDSTILEVIIAPLMFENMDGSPCCVIAKIK